MENEEKKKKKMRTRTKVIIASSAVLAVLIAVAVGIFMHIKASPEWALKEIISDVKSDGIDGLRAHSTEAFCEKIDKVENYAKEKGIGNGGSGSGDDQSSKSRLDMLKESAEEYIAAELLSKIKDMDWGLEDVKRSKKSADVVISFDDSKKLKGTFEINMVKEDGEWKIDNVDLSKCIQSAVKDLLFAAF